MDGKGGYLNRTDHVIILASDFTNESMIVSRPLQRHGIKRKRNFDESFIAEMQLDPLIEVPSDAKAALDHIVAIFPREKFVYSLPPVVLKHQLYSIVEDKTIVDRELNSLRDQGKIRFFKLDSGTDEFAIVYSEAYVEHVKNCAKNRDGAVGGENPALTLFLESILPVIKDVSIDQNSRTEKLGLSDEIITFLVNLGVLNVRDVKSWWISIPGSALFMKNFLAGRKAVLAMIKKRRYKEIFESEIEKRSIALHSKLGMKYHLFDVIGADLVMKVNTTGGVLLRYTGADKKHIKSKRNKKC